MINEVLQRIYTGKGEVSHMYVCDTGHPVHTEALSVCCVDPQSFLLWWLILCLSCLPSEDGRCVRPTRGSFYTSLCHPCCIGVCGSMVWAFDVFEYRPSLSPIRADRACVGYSLGPAHSQLFLLLRLLFQSLPPAGVPMNMWWRLPEPPRLFSVHYPSVGQSWAG